MKVRAPASLSQWGDVKVKKSEEKELETERKRDCNSLNLVGGKIIERQSG